MPTYTITPATYLIRNEAGYNIATATVRTHPSCGNLLAVDIQPTEERGFNDDEIRAMAIELRDKVERGDYYQSNLPGYFHNEIFMYVSDSELTIYRTALYRPVRPPVYTVSYYRNMREVDMPPKDIAPDTFPVVNPAPGTVANPWHGNKKEDK